MGCKCLSERMTDKEILLKDKEYEKIACKVKCNNPFYSPNNIFF